MREKKFDRKRYIAFEFVRGGEDTGRKALSNAIKERSICFGNGPKFEVILIRGRKGIILTSHLEANDLRELLNSFSLADSGFEIRTLGTSGTILTIKQKFFKGQEL